MRSSTSDSLNHLLLSITFFLEDHALDSIYFLEDRALDSKCFLEDITSASSFFKVVKSVSVALRNSSFRDPIPLLLRLRCIALHVSLRRPITLRLQAIYAPVHLPA